MDLLLTALLIFGGIMMFRFMRRRATLVPAGVGGGSGRGTNLLGDNVLTRNAPTSAQASGFTSAASVDENQVPAWFDANPFAEGAKSHFLRLQTAWDKADFRDIKEYTTPQLFEELQRERLGLGREPQITEVVVLNVQIAGTRRDGDLAVVSLEFSGLIREEVSQGANPFHEIWHIQHAWNTPEGDWFIAGIQQIG